MCQDSRVQLINNVIPIQGPAQYIQSIIDCINQSITCPAVAGRLAHFQCKLGNTNSRPVGVTNHGWLPTRIGNNPSSDYLPSSNEWIQGGTNPGNQRSGRAAIQGCHPGGAATTREFCVPDFLVEKKDGGQRPVVNLKCLIPDLIQPGDWMIKLVLKDAYLQVPIHPDHQYLSGTTFFTSPDVSHLGCPQPQESSPNC